VLLLLAFGEATNHVAYGAIAAGAAFSVGFGATRGLRGWNWSVMALAALAMTLAAFVGSLVGQWPAAMLALSAAAGAGVAWLALMDDDLWWVALQATIAMLVAGYYPGGLDAAGLRAGVVLSGGLVQIALSLGVALVAPRARVAFARSDPKPRPPVRLVLTHTLRAAACVGLSILAARSLGLANSYWAPLTALLVLKPGLHETQTRGLARFTGTLLGCAAASLLAVAVRSSPEILLVLAGLAAGLAFALQKASYAAFTVAVTATVVLFLTIGHGTVIANAEHRLIATVVGGAVTLALARIAPHRPSADHVAAPDRINASVQGADGS
jgi:hypothetical protein